MNAMHYQDDEPERTLSPIEALDRQDDGLPQTKPLKKSNTNFSREAYNEA